MDPHQPKLWKEAETTRNDLENLRALIQRSHQALMHQLKDQGRDLRALYKETAAHRRDIEIIRALTEGSHHALTRQLEAHRRELDILWKETQAQRHELQALRQALNLHAQVHPPKS